MLIETNCKLGDTNDSLTRNKFEWCLDEKICLKNNVIIMIMKIKK